MLEDGVQLSRDLVLVGGGHAHALVLRRWGMAPLPGARVTLISPEPTAPYTGMLPGHVAGHYPREALEIDLVRLCRFAGARLILARAEGLDLDGRTVSVTGRPAVAYDVLSLDIGIHGAVPGIPGLSEHGVPAKPLGPFADRWDGFVASVRGGETPPEVAVIGGGVAGVELALAMAFRLRNEGCEPSLTLIEAGERALDGLADPARRVLLRRLAELRVRVRTKSRVATVKAAEIRLEDGDAIPAALTVAAAGAVPYPWLAETGLATHEGSVAVDAHLQALGRPEVFAAGDCAHMTHAPRDKAGVYAVRQAPVLTTNLRAALRGRAPEETYEPQRRYLKLVSTGSRHAVGDRGGRLTASLLTAVPSGPLWRWKDRIDRRFMAKLTDLPAMNASPAPEEAAAGAGAAHPLCSGCGGKAGRDALRAGLAQLPRASRGDVITGPGDDAGVLAHGSGVQVLTTDSLRAFTDDPYLLAEAATIHALGDVWAMGAAPQAGLLTLTLPRMTSRLQERTIREATAAASEVLAAAGAALVGGHTSLGAELSVGLTVTGLADRAVGQDGARPGDVIVLTRPIGTGTILAGEMALRARGPDVAAAWAQMRRPGAEAAAVLAPVAHAMTDVTGFGLANHLLGICKASGVGAEIDLGAVPLLPGALALSQAGTRSSLYEENVSSARRAAPVPDDARMALFYDPQTAGGLLACVPRGVVEGVLHEVTDAAVIGVVVEGEGVRLRPWGGQASPASK